MRAILRPIVLLLLLIQSCLNEQPKPIENFSKFDNTVKFDTIIAHFKKRNYTHDTLKFPLIHKERDFSIEISDNPLPLDIKEVILKNPIDSQYPISYSVVFNNRLVSLFEPGVFVSHTIPKFERDIEFEKKLNTMKFQYHWITDKKLIGLSSNKYYVLNSDTVWEEYKEPVPVSSQPILYDDVKYIVFSFCHGEFGGTIFFYNKLTHKIHYTESTCANSVQKIGEKYLVYSSLAHMIGFIELKEVSDPEKLPIVALQNINKPKNGKILGYTDRTKIAKSIFSYSFLTSSGLFKFKNRTMYLLDMNDDTFLAEIENSTIRIINPLFNRELNNHGTITTNYEGTILVNLKYYLDSGKYREYACLILKDNQLIKLDWNEKHR